MFLPSASKQKYFKKKTDSYGVFIQPPASYKGPYWSACYTKATRTLNRNQIQPTISHMENYKDILKPELTHMKTNFTFLWTQNTIKNYHLLDAFCLTKTNLTRQNKIVYWAKVVNVLVFPETFAQWKMFDGQSNFHHANVHFIRFRI